MSSRLFFRTIFIVQLLIMHSCIAYGQVPILNYNTDVNGQVELEVNSTTDNYYILKVRHSLDSAFLLATSMTLGEAGTTVITESLEAYPIGHYEVLEYSISAPFDTDGDGIDDVTEFNNIPLQNPINAAPSIAINDGLVAIDNVSNLELLTVEHETVQWSPYLDGKEFVKFIILDYNTINAQIYFINTNTHSLHLDFATSLGLDMFAPGVIRGQIVYHPTVMSNNGTLGTYAFNYANADSFGFESVQKTHELLGLAMPFLQNNLSYYVNVGNEADYTTEVTFYDNSRIPVLFETDVYAGIDYWGLHQTEGYGYFRLVGPGDIPDSKDIVLYESIPNTLPRVGGIITSVIQTPLSHVNLRAIQDNIPNAFIRDPLDNDSIADLLDHYIYFNVGQSDYTIREATLAEVNAWYESIRPATGQTPPLNLDYKEIHNLDEITFHMFDGFGAKVANVATMKTFGFPDGTIPDGFGIPFYFYQEFMKYNDFFADIDLIMNNTDFIADREIRNTMLEEFREQIENAEMPNWMLDALETMHQSFPIGSSVRFRSSTNNEDLPGFSGAGLYDSKTHHPGEGHISKTIKEVYASLWNLRAFEEREFYRINHFYTSMGLLCHLNYADEKVNGVGISADPIYNTGDNFYLNSQLDDELITNPGNNTNPEELLLHRYPTGGESYSVIQYSSLMADDSLLMSEEHLDELRRYLSIIHDEFEELYNAGSNSTFAMDIEYKITYYDQLIIKQARPWVSYVFEPSTDDSHNCELIVFPNPTTEFLNVTCDDCNLSSVRITDFTGKLILDKTINTTNGSNTHISIQHLRAGMYFVSGYIDNVLCSSMKFIKE